MKWSLIYAAIHFARGGERERRVTCFLVFGKYYISMISNCLIDKCV